MHSNKAVAVSAQAAVLIVSPLAAQQLSISYFNIFIYLFLTLYSFYLVLIRCKVLLVTNIRTKLPLVLCSSSITIQTFHLLFTIGGEDLSFSLFHKNFPTLHKPSTLSHFVMSPRVTLCLSNTQVSVQSRDKSYCMYK